MRDPSDSASPGPAARRTRWPGSGVRSRVTAAFGAGAAALSVALAGGTYAVAHHYLLSEAQAGAESQTFADARLLRADLASPGTNLADVLSFLTPAQDTRSLVYRNGRWFSTSVSVGRDSLPTALLSLVRAVTPATQRVVINGSPELAVGLPLPAVPADYFEIHSLAELSRTLRILAAILGSTALVTTLGGIVVGRWASARLVRPLTSVAAVAGAISRGALDQRLPDDQDADLAPLVSSFNEMVDALAARIERDARFASDVSHELRSPLTTLAASVEVLGAYGAALPDPGRRALDLLRTEINRFSEMVQDLLEISRMDSGEVPLELETLPLDEVIVRTVEASSAGRVPVEVHPRARGATIRADRRRLQRVIANILDNADRYGRGATLVSVDCEGGWVSISIDDAGDGVAESERERIFERFYRGARARQRTDTVGTGLGLALTSEHVRAHGGRIRAEEAPSGGARFTIELPQEGP